jgi:hypothetical protein
MNFWVNDIHAIEALKAKRLSDKNLRILYGIQKSDEMKKEERAIAKAEKEAAKPVKAKKAIVEKVKIVYSPELLESFLKNFGK